MCIRAGYHYWISPISFTTIPVVPTQSLAVIIYQQDFVVMKYTINYAGLVATHTCPNILTFVGSIQTASHNQSYVLCHGNITVTVELPCKPLLFVHNCGDICPELCPKSLNFKSCLIYRRKL